MSAKVCVVTGATSGIGLETARILAEKGERVIGIGRDPERCARACEGIREGSAEAAVSFEIADLSSLAEIRAAARRISMTVDRVDVLVNNAGTFTFTRRETADCLERQLAVNWLAGFTLTRLLLPKLATVLFTVELARRLGPGSTISACAVDPGLVRTRIGAKGGNWIVRLIWGLRTGNAIPPRAAAESAIFCALDERAAGPSGAYWKECAVTTPSRLSRDVLDAMRLWDVGEVLSGVRYP